MVINIKSASETAKMFASGKLCATVMEKLKTEIREGISTLYLDELAEKLIKGFNAKASFKNYRGFPASICTSVNEEIVHGIPNRHKLLKQGDIISIDIGVLFDGYHSDMARTFPVGQISEDAAKLIEVTKQCFYEGFNMAREGGRLKDISTAVENCALAHNFGVVRELVGHGIGKNLHEAPDIPNFAFKGANPRLRAGMTLAIEPMINLGGAAVAFGEDNWLVYTKDKKLSAHYENTLLVTEGEPQIITKI